MSITALLVMEMRSFFLLMLCFMLCICITDAKYCGKPVGCYCLEKLIVCADSKLLRVPDIPKSLRMNVEYLNVNKIFLIKLEIRAKDWPKLRSIFAGSNPLLSCDNVIIPGGVQLKGLDCDA